MILRQSIGLRINQAAIWRAILSGAASASLSAALLAAEPDGLAFVSNDTAVSEYGSLTIKDTVTPANNYSGAPFDFQGGKLAHSRGGNAMEQDAAGLWKYANHNLILQSQTLDSATWNKASSSATANTIAAPDGTLTADTFTASSTGAFRYARQSISLSINQSYTYYKRLKYNNNQWVFLLCEVGTDQFAWFDVLNGVIGTQRPGVTASMTAQGDGWYLCSVTFTKTSASGLEEIGFGLADGDNVTTATASQAVYAWGSDLKTNPCISTKYIPTTSAAVYRPKRYRDPITLVNYGYWPEQQATNRVTYSDDLTNAAWTKVNATATKTATGIGGTANEASTLTATAANGTALFSITAASAQCISSAFVKRRTGSGVVEMTQDNGATWTPITVTGSFTRVNVPAATVLDPVVGFRIVTSGDEIDVQVVQNETGGVATSPIPTSGATATRLADAIAEFTAFNKGTAQTLYYKGAVVSAAATGATALALYLNGNNNTYIRTSTATAIQAVHVVAAGVDANLSRTVTAITTTHKAALSIAANDVALVANGSAIDQDLTAGTVSYGGLQIGGITGGVGWNGPLEEIMVLPRAMSTAEKQTVTA